MAGPRHGMVGLTVRWAGPVALGFILVSFRREQPMGNPCSQLCAGTSVDLLSMPASPSCLSGRLALEVEVFRRSLVRLWISEAVGPPPQRRQPLNHIPLATVSG